MKKSQSKPGEKGKPRRLVLSRETIQLLNHPGLSIVIGGQEEEVVPATSSMVVDCCPTKTGA